MKSSLEHNKMYQRTKGSPEEKKKKKRYNSSMSKKFMFIGLGKVTGCSFRLIMLVLAMLVD